MGGKVVFSPCLGYLCNPKHEKDMEFETGKKSNNRQQYRRKPVHESDAALEMGKTQPQDIEFEEAVLGAIMLEKDAYSEVSDLLTPESFYLRANQLIYEAIRDLGAQQLPIDLLTVTQQLRSNGHLDEVGGAVHISELTSRVASAANIEYHAQIVAQNTLRANSSVTVRRLAHLRLTRVSMFTT